MSREFWIDFLQLYKNNPCLWDSKSLLYLNKVHRKAAYDVMLQKYKLIDAEATLDTVKKKIDSFRSAYRREEKRVLVSQWMTPNNVYKPSLWYYDHLSFLSTASEEEIYTIPHNETNLPPKQDTSETQPSKKQRIVESKEELSDLAQALLDREKPDDCATFTSNLKLQMRELNTNQKYIAQKLISDVIFLARTNQLNNQSFIETNQAAEKEQSTSQKSPYIYMTIPSSLMPRAPSLSNPGNDRSPSPELHEQKIVTSDQDLSNDVSVDDIVVKTEPIITDSFG